MPTEPPAWAPPLMAVQFLTRLPVPWLARLSPEQARAALARAVPWLPPVGGLIGLATGGGYLAALALWPPAVAILLALAAEAWLTGAFHEDAVADFCDAFGGQARGARALEIMKDSRIGSYGALGLGLFVALRAAATIALDPPIALAAIVAAATMARLWAVLLLALCPPAPSGHGMARDIGGARPAGILMALALAMPGLAALAMRAPGALIAAGAAGAVVLPALAAFLRRRIAGSTGDCLGFAAYAGQLAMLLAAAAAG